MTHIEYLLRKRKGDSLAIAAAELIANQQVIIERLCAMTPQPPVVLGFNPTLVGTLTDAPKADQAASSEHPKA